MTNTISPAGQAHIARLSRRIAQYQRSIRYLEANGAPYHTLLCWYEKIELAENVIRMIEDGVYDEMTGEVV